MSGPAGAFAPAPWFLWVRVIRGLQNIGRDEIRRGGPFQKSVLTVTSGLQLEQLSVAAAEGNQLLMRALLDQFAVG